jgi:hypothetical protein
MKSNNTRMNAKALIHMAREDIRGENSMKMIMNIWFQMVKRNKTHAVKWSSYINKNLNSLNMLEFSWSNTTLAREFKEKREMMKKLRMADYLSTVFEGEKNTRVKCPFYTKIGACRHGINCTRSHAMPNWSQTVLLKNFYVSPLNTASEFVEMKQYTNEELQAHFEETYEELFVELEKKYGDLEELNICENIGWVLNFNLLTFAFYFLICFFQT